MKTIFLLFFSLFSVNLQAKSFYVLTPQVGQGGTAIVRIDPNYQGSLVCISAFDRQFIPNKNGYAIMGIPADIKPTKDMTNQIKYLVFMVECGRGVRLNWNYEEIEVLETDFEKTRVATSTAKPKPRSGRHKRAIDRAFNQTDRSIDLTNGRIYIDPLDMARDVIDPFGHIYSNNPYLFHTGGDLRAPVETPVKAVNRGNVVFIVKNFRRSREGNMMILYHGLGIFSVYMHLSKFQVREGNTVERGEIIGLTGKTGAGANEDPHLHWNMRVQDVYVDPFKFIDTVNKFLP